VIGRGDPEPTGGWASQDLGPIYWTVHLSAVGGFVSPTRKRGAEPPSLARLGNKTAHAIEEDELVVPFRASPIPERPALVRNLPTLTVLAAMGRIEWGDGTGPMTGMASRCALGRASTDGEPK